MLETDKILSLWLEEVPCYTATFVKLMLCITLLDSTANPIMNANAATGKVKTYQLIIGSIVILVLPISYFLLKMGCEPWVVFAVHLGICSVTFITRLLLVSPQIQLSLKTFFTRVIIPCSMVLIASMPIPLTIMYFMEKGILRILLIVIICILNVSIAAFFLAFTSEEQKFVKGKVLELWGKLKKSV